MTKAILAVVFGVATTVVAGEPQIEMCQLQVKLDGKYTWFQLPSKSVSTIIIWS